MPLLKPERWCDVIMGTDPFDGSVSSFKSHVIRAGMSRMEAESFHLRHKICVRPVFIMVVNVSR